MEVNPMVLTHLEGILGKGSKKARNNYAFHCPFCNHRKPKLEIQMQTNEKGHNPWECWVCNTRGRTIKSLLRQLKVDRSTSAEILKYIKKGDKVEYHDLEFVELPKEFQALTSASTTSIIANKVRRYLYKRGLTDYDFIKYNIGYCTSGEYQDRIIVPSYDDNNNLNFFVARSFADAFIKYKNPSASKDIIGFENTINWDQPIVLVEGVFDAMAVKRNAIPLLGKFVPKTLNDTIYKKEVKSINILLDEDAQDQALYYTMQFQNQGITTRNIKPSDKDAGEMGFSQVNTILKESKQTEFGDIISQKLAGL